MVDHSPKAIGSVSMGRRGEQAKVQKAKPARATSPYLNAPTRSLDEVRRQLRERDKAHLRALRRGTQK